MDGIFSCLCAWLQVFPITKFDECANDRYRYRGADQRCPQLHARMGSKVDPIGLHRRALGDRLQLQCRVSAVYGYKTDIELTSRCSALVSIGYATFFAPKTAWGGFDRKEAFRKLGTITSLGLAGKSASMIESVSG